MALTELMNKAIALAATMGVDFAELGPEARQAWVKFARSC